MELGGLTRHRVHIAKHRTRATNHIASLALPLALIVLLTALLGVWAAYDRGTAWMRFGLIATGVVLAGFVAWLGWRWGERGLGLVGLGCALLAGGLGAYFLLTWDFSGDVGAFAPFLALGLRIQALRPVVPVPEDLNSNVAANGLIVLIPLAVAGLAWAWRRHHALIAGLAGLGGLVGLLALALTHSRAAWLGLAVGTAAALLLAFRMGSPSGSLGRRLAEILLVVGAIALLAGFWMVATRPQLGMSLGSVSAGGSLLSRPVLWQDGLALVRDYPFTGSGLGSTAMVYSTYGRLIHVPFTIHMHNLFLQIAVEQGIFGLLAFLGLCAVAFWHLGRACAGSQERSEAVAEPSPWLCLPAVVALVATLVYGLLDAGTYSSLLVVLAFLPIGYALGVGGRKTEGGGREEPVEGKRRAAGLVVAVVSMAVLALVLFMPSGRAALQANLGAVAQTRAELGVYSWPQWPIQDALRRAPEVDLGPALARYHAALASNPTDAVANRRLGQIELSMGQYGSARQHLETAYAAAPGQRAVRQLLAESYAIEGDLAHAISLLDGLDLSQGQLLARATWYASIGEPERASAIEALME